MMNLSKCALMVALCILVAAAASIAAPQSGSSEPPPLQLSLQDAIAMGMDNNLDMQVASYTPQLREQDVVFQEAAFDPNIFGSANFADNSQPAQNQFDRVRAIEGTLDTYQLNFRDPLMYGANYTASLFMQRQTSTSANAPFPTSYFTQFQLAYNQALLRNSGKKNNETQITIARNNQKIGKSQFEDQVLASLQQIEDAYWELVFARQDLDVNLESLGLAEELLKLNRIKVEVGTLPPIEITQAEAEVANREQGVIVAENAVRDAEDLLRQVLNMPKSDGMWSRPIVTTDEPLFMERPVNLEQELDEAYRKRPDLEQARLEINNADTQLNLDKQDQRWDLRFRGTYRLQGLAGDDLSLFVGSTRVTLPIDEDFGDSLDRLSDGDFDSWTARIDLNIPIGNNTAQANYINSRLAREQSEMSYENTRLAAEVEVRQAARQITTDKKRIHAAEKNVELQRKKVDAEQKKFENGMSTSFQVLEFQRDLTTALGDKNRALVDYRKSITALEKAKGTLPDYLNVTMK